MGARWSPLRWTLASLALFALATSLIVSALIWRTNDLLTRQVLQVIAAEARSLNEQYRNGGLPLLVQAVSERSRQPGNGLYLLVDGAGIRLAGNLEAIPLEIQNEPGGGLFHYALRASGHETQRRLAIGLPIRVPGQGAGGSPGQSPQSGVQLIVARDIDDISAFARSTQTIFLTGIGLTTLLALAGAALYSQGLRRRVEAVTAASQRIMAGDLTQRLPVTGGSDEINRLSVSLNVMLERIEQLMTGLREVSDNIAHDLKTPLTRLRNRAEAALRDTRGATAYREGLERTLEEADELIKTFNALLAIARLEAGASSDQAEAIDLAAIVHETVELYEPVVEEAGLRITFTATNGMAPAGLMVMGDRQLIGQAVVNLIENAIKYGCNGADACNGKADGGRVARNLDDTDIAVMVAARPGLADIIVADRGPGIAEADRQRVLKRFVRLETSRTRPGTGLGLSLVAAVARIHRGTIKLEDNAPGLRVVLSLPLTTLGSA